jgi:hypothetical protein
MMGRGLAAQELTEPPTAKTTLVEPPAPLLPVTLGELRRLADIDVGDGLGGVDGSDRAVLTEDGLRRFARSGYAESAKASDGLNVTVYQFNDASGAVAAYDYFKKPGMRHEPLAGQAVSDQAVSDQDELLLRTGVNVVRERPGPKASRSGALTRKIIDALPKTFGTSALDPPLPRLLPEKGLDRDSIKYAFGPTGYQADGGVLSPQIVGFDKAAETVTAHYRGDGVLTLIEYPTPQIAGDRERTIAADLNRTNGSGSFVKIRREGPLLILATGGWKATDAAALVNGIHLHDQLTWNKQMPLEFHAEVGKTYSLLVSVAILSAVGALAAIVLGLFFGGGRALIRVMQGKPAATEPEFLRIDLRGRPDKRLGVPEA